MLRKLLVVYNPRSSQHVAVQREVLAPARQLRGWMVGKYEIKPTSFADNVAKIEKLVGDGDIVIVAGGDGTATMAMNGILQSGKDVTVGVVGYGNFNDVAGMLGMRRSDFSGDGESGVGASVGSGAAFDAVTGCATGSKSCERETGGFDVVAEVMGALERNEERELYPIEIRVNGKHWRYAISYYSMGLLAQATTLMEQPKVRKKLNSGRATPLYSLWMAVWWYLKNHRKIRLPRGKINGEELCGWGARGARGSQGSQDGEDGEAKGCRRGERVGEDGEAKGCRRGERVTDYLAVNGVSLAKIMKGEARWQEREEFGSTVQGLGGFWKMVWFGLRSITKGVPLVATKGDVIEFDEPGTVEMHVEGEYEKMEGVRTVEVKKAGKVKVIVR